MTKISGYETEEQRKEHVLALLREREGAEVALASAEQRNDEPAAAAARENIEAVDNQLRIFGHKGSKPQAQAEQRPAPSGSTR